MLSAPLLTAAVDAFKIPDLRRKLLFTMSMLVAFRFIGGLGIGGSSVLGPMYIAEISPAAWRGRLVGFFQFNIVLGILLAYLSNYLIGLASFGSTEWRWELGAVEKTG